MNKSGFKSNPAVFVVEFGGIFILCDIFVSRVEEYLIKRLFINTEQPNLTFISISTRAIK